MPDRDTGERGPLGLPDVSRDELLEWTEPFPSPGELRIDGLTDEQEEAFWLANSEA